MTCHISMIKRFFKIYIVLRIWIGAEMCHPSFSKGLPCIGHGPGRERRREARGEAGPFHVDQEWNDLAAEAERLGDGGAAAPDARAGVSRRKSGRQIPEFSRDACAGELAQESFKDKKRAQISEG